MLYTDKSGGAEGTHCVYVRDLYDIEIGWKRFCVVIDERVTRHVLFQALTAILFATFFLESLEVAAAILSIASSILSVPRESLMCPSAW